ncbi:MAG: recombinase family protein [Solirubrobacteraceae bacterium]|nr:recombinase family protein [Solirubrobacteraceae bacterium]
MVERVRQNQNSRAETPEAQHDALTAAGCEDVFMDSASGKLASRPELDNALLVAKRAGDQLVITRQHEPEDQAYLGRQHSVSVHENQVSRSGENRHVGEGLASVFEPPAVNLDDGTGGAGDCCQVDAAVISAGLLHP